MKSSRRLYTGIAIGEKPYRLLKGIAASGSLNKTRKKLKMSPCHARHVLGHFEETVGFALIEKKRGGAGGGGCTLTGSGTRFIARYERFRAEAVDAVDELFRTHLPPTGRENAVLITAMAEEPYRLLKAVKTFGSLNKATGTVRKCYCSARRNLNRFEKAAGVTLVERRIGGVLGGGCKLTATGKRFVRRYGRVRKELSERLDDLFRKRTAFRSPYPCDPVPDACAARDRRRSR